MGKGEEREEEAGKEAAERLGLDLGRSSASGLVGCSRQQSLEAAETIIHDADELLTGSEMARTESRQLAVAWDLQAALSYLITNYVDQEDVLLRLMAVKDNVDQFLEEHSLDDHPENLARSLAQFEEDLKPSGNFPVSRKTSREPRSVPVTPVRTPAREDSTEAGGGWTEAHLEEVARSLDGIGAPAAEEELESCSICFEEKVLEMLPCGHVFCADCVQMHLHTMITEGRALELQCPALGCHEAISREVAHDFLTEAQFRRYCQFLLTAQIRDDPDRKCCPTADCTGVLRRSTAAEGQEAWLPHPYTRCEECDTETCFQCLRAFHSDESCTKYEQGLLLRHLLADEENLSRWREENNAKPCPRCNELIVKSEGCNHIRCMTCGENFCWLCSARNATEGHFNLPGKCFGRLFEEEESSEAENTAGRIAALILLPITAPAFGFASVIESARRQKAKMARRLHGTDFKVVLVGGHGSGKSSLCKTIAAPVPLGSLAPLEPFGVEKYTLTITVNLVRCRFSLLNCPIESLQAKEVQAAVADMDGFVVCFSTSDVETFDAVVTMHAALTRVAARGGVPGLLLGTRLSKKQEMQVGKAAAQQRAATLGMRLRLANPSSSWSSHLAFRSFAKKLLTRWEPVVAPVLQEHH